MKHGSCASANQSKCTGLSDSKQLLTGHEIGYYCLLVCVNASLIGGIQTGREEGTVEGRGDRKKQRWQCRARDELSKRR